MKSARSLLLLPVLVLAGCVEDTPDVAPVDPTGTKRAGNYPLESVRSPTGDLVAFTRGTPDRLVESPVCWLHEATEIWISNPDGSDQRLLVRGDEGHSDLHNLQFSPDGRELYYLCSGCVTTHSLNAVDVQTGNRRHVCPGNSFEVVRDGMWRDGTYRGHLIVEQHRYYPMGGSYDWPWLFTPDGKCLSPVRQGPDGGIDPFVLSMCLDRPARPRAPRGAQAGRTGG